MKKPIIGILTWREGNSFAEPGYFRQLCKEGEELGATVFLFSPADVFPDHKRVRGFTPAPAGGKGWVSRIYPRPDAVIDRYRYSPNQAFKDYVAHRQNDTSLYTNNRLANKWAVHRVLYQDERMHRWLPETWEYSRPKLREMTKAYPVLYAKPINGTGGRGILKIERRAGAYHLLGRDKQRARKRGTTRTYSTLRDWVENWKKREKFVIQQGLDLNLVPGRAVDMRLLIQKNELGQWSVTGLGVRVGGRESATSNLHGGGKAIPAKEFLTPRFGVQRTHAILSECHELAHQTAVTVENHYGRMMELGLDIGIDTDGRVWLIEINPKPGREIFKQMGQKLKYQQSIRRPLQYALYLIELHKKIRTS
ncbi:YheC/YheD family endospore coat-associated protein [Brevibacillus dissolubilis]|uniref:YheC/YheD family endospore coat-associated protein n=1 Tax=Brevibacillus dissolubilis TaxID=1844116 RepID=UPI001116363B|nr:YheC/YheD family protein [Brevibacillus dissolubilis]